MKSLTVLILLPLCVALLRSCSPDFRPVSKPSAQPTSPQSFCRPISVPLLPLQTTLSRLSLRSRRFVSFRHSSFLLLLLLLGGDVERNPGPPQAASIKCICGSFKEEGNLVECELRHLWSHCKCVKISVSLAATYPFICAFCIKSSLVSLASINSKISSLENKLSSLSSEIHVLSLAHSKSIPSLPPPLLALPSKSIPELVPRVSLPACSPKISPLASSIVPSVTSPSPPLPAPTASSNVPIVHATASLSATTVPHSSVATASVPPSLLESLVATATTPSLYQVPPSLLESPVRILRPLPSDSVHLPSVSSSVSHTMSCASNVSFTQNPSVPPTSS